MTRFFQTRSPTPTISDDVPTEGTTASEDLAEQRHLEPTNAVNTYVLGIAKPDEDAPAFHFFGRVALKGGGAPSGCDPQTNDVTLACHFPVPPGTTAATTDAVVAALDAIHNDTRSCEFYFTPNASTDLDNVDVRITSASGKVKHVSKDPKNGWSFDDPSAPTRVLLHGSACVASNPSALGRVEVTIGCH